jgi:hypothetical protein
MASEAAEWAQGPLYKALVAALPGFLIDSTTDSPRLCVAAVAKELKISREIIYRWLRAGSVNTRNAKRLVELARTTRNLAVLHANGTQPVEFSDFVPFLA